MKRKSFILIALFLIITEGYSQKSNTFRLFKTDKSNIYDICFTNKGGALGIADGNSVKVYSTKSGELLNEFKNGHKNQILIVDISQDSTIMVSGGKDSTIVIWDLVNNKRISSLTYQKGIITSAQISPDGNFLVSGGTDDKVFLYDIKKGVILHEFTDHIDDVTSVKFSHDGKLIASASGDKTLKIYDVNSFKLIESLSGHRSWVRDISFSEDGSKLISCGDDSRIITWNISDAYDITKQSHRRIGYNWLLGIDFYKDNYVYAYGGINGKAIIVTTFGNYNTKIHRPIQKILFKPREDNYLTIAIATLGKGVILIDAKDMKYKKP